LPESWQGTYSEARTRKWIRDRDREGTQLLVTSRSSGEPVGLLLLHEERRSGGGVAWRLGYLLAESQWGRGLASELVGGFVEWARNQGPGSIVAGVSVTNPASIRVLEKSGFTLAADVDATERFYQAADHETR
jgi:RimJ/RimL family protein N-acetyltransferase